MVMIDDGVQASSPIAKFLLEEELLNAIHSVAFFPSDVRAWVSVCACVRARVYVCVCVCVCACVLSC